MLKDILREIIVLTVGKQAEEISDLLNSKNHVNEFVIAKKLGITINQTRNILYKISDFGLVSSIRKKDKKKGWYTYFWKFETLKALKFIQSIYLEEKTKLEKEVNEREQGRFFVCKFCNVEHTEEEALIMNFTCDECGEILEVRENKKVTVDLQRQLKKIYERLGEIAVEIEKEDAKIVKIREVERKKEEKEKEKKKEIARKKRALKRTLNKAKAASTKKKVIKKKVIKKKAVKKKRVADKKAAKKKTTKKSVKKKSPKKKTIKKTTKKATRKKK